jgi:hypothetical protein
MKALPANWIQLLLSFLVSLGISLACAPAKERASGDASNESKISPSPAINPDLKHYPQPESLPGAALVVAGATRIMPEIRKPDRGGRCPVTVDVRGDTTYVTLLSLPINCCTEEIAPSVEVKDGVAEIRIWEYMTDICECFTQRAVRFALAPFDPSGLEFHVFLNDRSISCWDGPPAANGD